jgi:hypothetical protein
MKKNIVAERSSMTGTHIVRTWRSGEIDRLLLSGIPFADAVLIAEKRGFLISRNVIKNLITTVGYNLAAKWSADVEAVGLTWYAIGTGTNVPAIGNTQLQTEVKRKAFATRSVASAVALFSAYFPKADCTYNIKEVGVFGSSTASITANSGICFSRAALAYDNSGGTVDLTFDYELTFSA